MADYVQQLETTLQGARLRVKKGREAKALKAGAPTLFEIIDLEISLAVNKMVQDTPLTDREYLSLHGEVKGMKRIRNLVNSAEMDEPIATAEAEAIVNNLENLK